MGMDASARICLGIPFDEGFEFPWEGLGLDDWYYEKVKPFISSIPYPYDEHGEYLPGKTKEDGSAYHSEKLAWKKANPMLIEEERCGSDDSYAPALVVKDLSLYYDWENISEVDIDALNADVSKEKQLLIDFCKEHGIETDEEPKWIILCRYW